MIARFETVAVRVAQQILEQSIDLESEAPIQFYYEKGFSIAFVNMPCDRWFCYIYFENCQTFSHNP